MVSFLIHRSANVNVMVYPDGGQIALQVALESDGSIMEQIYLSLQLSLTGLRLLKFIIIIPLS